MSANNVKQADVITGATVLTNANGTAPGNGSAADPMDEKKSSCCYRVPRTN